MNFWDEKYKEKPSLYGEKPNYFLASRVFPYAAELPDIKTSAELACGEGRNAIYYHSLGKSIDAYDYSEVAITNCKQNAVELHGTAPEGLHFHIHDFLQAPTPEWYDFVYTTYFHVPIEQKDILFKHIADSIKPGGYFAMECFHPDQRIHNCTSGGPPSPDMMYTVEDIRNAFPKADFLVLEETEVELNEGRHSGKAFVTRCFLKRGY